jgi:hypothetical protein
MAPPRSGRACTPRSGRACPPRSGKACTPRSGKACPPRRRVRVWQQRASSPKEHTRYPSRSFTCCRASERGSCGYPKLFWLLPFPLAARRAPPRPRSSPCRRARALFCTRIAASTRFDGVTATLGPFFGADAATMSVAAIPAAPAQAARREAGIAQSLPQAQKFSGSTFRVVADGSTRRPRARVARDEHGISVRVGLSA